MPFGTTYIEQMADFLLWYGKNKTDPAGRPALKYHLLFIPKDVRGDQDWVWYLDKNGEPHRMTTLQHATHVELPDGARIYRLKSLEPSGRMDSGMFDYEFEGRKYRHPKNGYGTTPEGMDTLKKLRRLQPKGNLLNYRLFLDDFPISPLTAPWTRTIGADDKRYTVQTNTEVVQRCMLMTTDPGDLVLDPTCGSGTTAFVAERWGRRWITCDTSRVAITLSKQRLMTALYHYYDLSHPGEGVDGGFKYETVQHITLSFLANNPEISRKTTSVEAESAIGKCADRETLYDKPLLDNTKARVTGPFTVEAVPAPTVRPIDEVESEQAADESVGRSGETLRQDEWRGELLNCGIRAKGGQHIHFTRVEPLAGTRWLHVDAETREDKPQRAVISFGPEHAPLEQRQVELALEEAQLLKPTPKMLVFASFHFDPEAAKDIDETNWPGVTLLKVQMNTDLLTDDLKKQRSSNESFWMIGQPDVQLRRIKDGKHKGKFEVEVCGFDYYNPRDGKIESGDTSKIAMWMLDTDYDGRSLYPRQVFFPMAGPKDGWARLAKSLKAEIDEDLIEAYRGTISLPFEPGDHKRVAVKIVDDRGIESLKIVEVG